MTLFKNIALAVVLLSSSANAQTVVKTQPAASPTRTNAAPMGGVSNVLIPGGPSSVNDNCSVPNTLGYGTTMTGLAINLQHADSNCIRLRKVYAWLNIANASGDKFYAIVAVQLMLQDEDNKKAYLAAHSWYKQK